MLVLTRKVGEKIRIGGNVELIVLRVGPRGIRLGFTAPPDVPIVRDDARRQNSRAAVELCEVQE